MGKESWGSGWWGNSTWVRTGTPWRTGHLWLWTMLIHVASFSWSGFETTRNFLQCSPWWKQYIFLPPHTYTLSHSLGSLVVSSFFWRNHCFSMQSSSRRFVSVLDLLSSVQFSSVAQLCPTLCDPMICSRPGLPVHHKLPEFTQTHVHRVGDAIQPCHPLSSPSPPAPNPSQHQGLFQWVNSLHEVAKVLEFQFQHQSFQWTPRTDLL